MEGTFLIWYIIGSIISLVYLIRFYYGKNTIIPFLAVVLFGMLVPVQLSQALDNSRDKCICTESEQEYQELKTIVSLDKLLKGN